MDPISYFVDDKMLYSSYNSLIQRQLYKVHDITHQFNDKHIKFMNIIHQFTDEPKNSEKSDV